MNTLKLMTLSLIALALCVNSWNWIHTCESYYAPGKPHPKGLEQKCSLIWEKLTYEYKLELPN